MHFAQKDKEFIMSKVCMVTGKRPLTGNHVSHANNKRKKRFLPNLHTHRLWSPQNQCYIKLKLSNKGMRIVDKKGIDAALTDVRANGFKV
jgi:large subunit ribosomal protein L28